MDEIQVEDDFQALEAYESSRQYATEWQDEIDAEYQRQDEGRESFIEKNFLFCGSSE